MDIDNTISVYNLNFKSKRNRTVMNASSDDTLDLLKDFLPEIEEQLRKQIGPQLQQLYENRLKEEVEKIEKQAEEEYRQALQTLQNEFLELKNEKEHELEIELIKNQQSFHDKQRIRLEHAQERFLQDHFDDKILNHQKMLDIEQNLQTQILEFMLDKYEVLRDKRIKQLRIRIENKELKERAQTQKAIRAEIYSTSGLQELRTDISKFKIYLASMKSKYNIKINKINTEIKDLQKKCHEIQYKNSDMIIQELEKEISLAKQEIVKRQNLYKNVEQSNLTEKDNSFYPFQTNQNKSLAQNMSKHKVFHLINQQNGNSFGGCDAQYINEDVDMESNDSYNDDDDEYQHSRQSNNLPPPPMSHAQMLNKLLTDEHEYQIQREEAYDTNQIYLERPAEPLLKLNVAKMLREQWYEDSFDRFVSQRNEKQNNINVSNQNNKANNFQSLYEEHLKKLNRESKIPKLKKLTEKAKNKLIMNFNTNQSRQNAYDF